MDFRNFPKKTFENFRKYSQNVQEILFFVQTRKNLTHGLLKFVEKYTKIMRFSNFLK